MKFKILGKSSASKFAKLNLYDVILSFNSNNILKATRLFKNGNIEWAKYLGYPDCCINNFIK